VAERSRADEVISGVAYTVRTVNGHAPGHLDHFSEDPIVVVVVAYGDQAVTIHGAPRRDGDAVVVYEKDGDGSGKDVRTWVVRQHGDRFEAAERAIF
jgi:hypothetical protein